jgi:hypothetical protein
MSRPQNVPFTTYDAALASSLIIKGFKLQSYRPLHSGKAYFTFHAADSLEEAIELYWNDRLLLNARTLLKQYQELLQTTNDRKR